MFLNTSNIFLAFKLSDVVIITLINIKMPKIIGIVTFMSMVNFMLSSDRENKIA